MLLGSHKLIHYACSHRKNQFVKKLKRHAGKTLWVHTGTIDSCWGMMKDSVPDQLPTCKNDQSKLNDLIWTYVRAWQWRWQSHVHGQALLKKWILLGADVTSPAKCAAAVVSQPTPYETGHFFKCQICKLCRKTQVKL